MYKPSITIRPFKEDDYILINKWRNDPQLQKYTVGPFRYVSLGIEKEWVKSKMMNNQKDIYWAIILNDDSKKMIGYTSLNDIDHFNKKAHWGGIVIGDKDYQDGTAVLEASIMIHEYAFEQLNLNRLSGSHFPEHPFTPAFSQALGWNIEGVKRESVFKDGKYRDLNYCSILRSDYNNLKEANLFNLKSITKRLISIIKGQKNVK